MIILTVIRFCYTYALHIQPKNRPFSRIFSILDDKVVSSKSVSNSFQNNRLLFTPIALYFQTPLVLQYVSRLRAHFQFFSDDWLRTFAYSSSHNISTIGGKLYRQCATRGDNHATRMPRLGVQTSRETIGPRDDAALRIDPILSWTLLCDVMYIYMCLF